MIAFLTGISLYFSVKRVLYSFHVSAHSSKVYHNHFLFGRLNWQFFNKKRILRNIIRNIRFILCF